MGSIDVLELVTHDTFAPDRYMLTNRNLRAAGVDPVEHFRIHGQYEGWRQITSDMLSGSPYRRSKFQRFRNILTLPGIAEDTFPVASGSRHFSLDDYDAESANKTHPSFAAEMERNPSSLYADIGCGLRDRVYENCLYVEVYPSLSADLIVEPNKPYPIRSGALDGIGCFAVLEHVRRPWEVVAEIHRMLKPGGKAFINWPFLQPIHGYPSHFFNATGEGLRTIFEDTGFAIETSGVPANCWPDATISWILGKFVHDLPADRRDRISNMTVGELLSHPPYSAFWRELMRDLPPHTVAEFAMGFEVVARKQHDQ